MTTEEWIIQIVSDTDSKGYLKARENTRLEFKESFIFANIGKYFKTIASFANAKGGIILFGVKDAPRQATGIDYAKFEDIQQDKIATFLIDFFSPQIIWDIGIIEHDKKYFGYIEIQESEDKPVICKKNTGKDLKNGEIYYRYRAQSRVIEFPELKSLQDEVKLKERNLWMKHIERISKIGPQNIAFIDLFDGAIETGMSDKQFLLNEHLLNELKEQVKFIEEGKFVEKDGAPAIKIIGEASASTSDVIAPNLNPNKDYPYLAKHLAQEIGIRRYDIQVMIWKYELKGNLKYHIEVETGANSNTNKYSKYALSKLKKIYDQETDKTAFLAKIGQEYNESKKLN